VQNHDVVSQKSPQLRNILEYQMLFGLSIQRYEQVISV